MEAAKALIDSYSAEERSTSRMTLIVKKLVGARRRIISVGYRVHKLSFLGKDTSVNASSTELFPAD